MSKRKADEAEISDSDSETETKKVKVEEAPVLPFPPPGTTHLYMSPTEDGGCCVYSFNSNSVKDPKKIFEVIAKVHDIKEDVDQIGPAVQVFGYLVTKSGFAKNKANQCLYNEEEWGEDRCAWLDELGEDFGEWAYFNEVHRFKNPGNIVVSLHTQWC
jgi:hypothetical protein